MYNKITIIGHIGQDPKMVTGNVTVLTLSVATNEGYKDRDGNWKDVTQWHNVQIWGKFGEAMMDKLQKGDLVLVTGPYRSNKGKNRSGDDVYYYNIRADVVRRLNKREKQTAATHEEPTRDNPQDDGSDPFEPETGAGSATEDSDSDPF
jgi:single-strand DNA-binding protein